MVEDLGYNGVQTCVCSEASSGYFLAVSKEQKGKKTSSKILLIFYVQSSLSEKLEGLYGLESFIN